MRQDGRARMDGPFRSNGFGFIYSGVSATRPYANPYDVVHWGRLDRFVAA